MSKWIPVDERLPKIGVSVLAVDFGKVCEMAWNGRYWVVPSSNWVGDGVTHWMKMPEPPGECRMADEIERLRLTDEERQALCWVCGDVADITGPTEDTLRRLLDRTK